MNASASYAAARVSSHAFCRRGRRRSERVETLMGKKAELSYYLQANAKFVEDVDI
jgi:hypothetical protein